MSQADLTLAPLAALCLALPEAEQRHTWDSETFRIRGKIFAMHVPTRGMGGHDGRPAMWCKAPPGAQAILMEAAPERFFRPPYVGPKGWIGVWLDGDVDWAEVTALVRRSWTMTAPKRLAASLSAPITP